MQYLVDSDWAIDYLDGLPAAVQLVQSIMRSGIAISIITYIEVYQGIIRLNTSIADQGLDALLSTTPVLPISLAVAQRVARLRELLQRQGRRTRSRALDLIIAATAIEHDLTLVTRNIDDYRDIPGITIYQ
jgi:predicted nucleic acid-binding protein